MIDLHLHIDGSLSPRTARKLAGIQGIVLPYSDEELKSAMSVMQDCHSLNEYLERFSLPCSLLHMREALYMCTFELLDTLASQGLKYAEIRFAPQKSCAEGMSQYEAAEIVLRAIRGNGFPCGLILSMMRGDDNHVQNMETVEVARALHNQGVVAVDLAGGEALFPTYTFAEEFAAVRAAGLPLIVHAGEADGPESVRFAVEAGAVRIGHGVRSLEDPEVVKLLVERRIMLELCPTSNLHTGIFPSYEAYPLRELMDAGVRVCINTDNMTVSNTTLHEEWQRIIAAKHLQENEIYHILRDTVDASFAPESVKEALNAQLDLTHRIMCHHV